MKRSSLTPILASAGLLVAVPAFAQNSATTNSPTTTTAAPAKAPHHTSAQGSTGHRVSASKQRTDGNSPTMIGPGSGAYSAQKQRTDGNSPTMVGPGSAAFNNKQ